MFSLPIQRKNLADLAQVDESAGFHRTPQSDARTGSVRSVFGRPIGFATRSAGEQSLARHYRCFSGQQVCPLPLLTVPDDYNERLRDLR